VTIVRSHIDDELKYFYIPKRRVYQICMREYVMTLENLLVALLSGPTRLLVECGRGLRGIIVFAEMQWTCAITVMRLVRSNHMSLRFAVTTAQLDYCDVACD
jgi:hypothetical protein